MKYLNKTASLDFDHPVIREIIRPFSNLDTEEDKIEQVYLKVRDGWRYNPYHISFQKDDFRASEIAQRSDGHCIDKAILMVTFLRGLGIPARIHLAKVTNHMAVEKLIAKLGSHELAPHGMVDVFHKGNWVKASPTFNKELCDKFGVLPVAFNGSKDALLQPFDAEGEIFMEYLDDYGYFEDVPFDFILETFKSHYPRMWKEYRHQGGMKL